MITRGQAIKEMHEKEAQRRDLEKLAREKAYSEAVTKQRADRAAMHKQVLIARLGFDPAVTESEGGEA